MPQCSRCHFTFDNSYREPIIGACGHSVCRRCALGTISPTNSRKIRCPICDKPSAFKDMKRNHQMTEVINELDSVSNERRKVQRLLDERDWELQKLLHCHLCNAGFEEKKSRVCQPCCVANGSLAVVNGAVTIIDCQKLDESMMCAACFLEGPHEGHKSLLLFQIKLKSAAKSFEDIREEPTRFKENFTRETEKMVISINSIQQLLSAVEKNSAQSVVSMSEYEEIVRKCRKHMDKMREIETNTMASMRRQLSGLETIERRLTNILDSVRVEETPTIPDSPVPLSIPESDSSSDSDVVGMEVLESDEPLNTSTTTSDCSAVMDSMLGLFGPQVASFESISKPDVQTGGIV